jgi:type IV pilus assembly protein PilF
MSLVVLRAGPLVRNLIPAGLVAALAALLLLGPAGCAAGPDGELRDRVTTSDETQEARRARVRLELAAAYFARGQMNVALDEVKLALAADPTLGPAFNLRGLIYSNLGENQLAEDSFRRAMSLNPRDGDTLHNFGWYLCRERRYAEANDLFERAINEPRYREMVRTLLAQGVCQARAGQYPLAERTLTRAYELDAANPATAFNLAEVLLRRGELERARYYIRRVNAQPDFANAESLWLAARIEHRLGNAAGANDFANQLRSRFPQSPEARAFEQRRFDD